LHCIHNTDDDAVIIKGLVSWSAHLKLFRSVGHADGLKTLPRERP